MIIPHWRFFENQSAFFDIQFNFPKADPNKVEGFSSWEPPLVPPILSYATVHSLVNCHQSLPITAPSSALAL